MFHVKLWEYRLISREVFCSAIEFPLPFSNSPLCTNFRQSLLIAGLHTTRYSTCHHVMRQISISWVFHVKPCQTRSTSNSVSNFPRYAYRFAYLMDTALSKHSETQIDGSLSLPGYSRYIPWPWAISLLILCFDCTCLHEFKRTRNSSAHPHYKSFRHFRSLCIHCRLTSHMCCLEARILGLLHVREVVQDTIQ